MPSAARSAPVRANDGGARVRVGSWSPSRGDAGMRAYVDSLLARVAMSKPEADELS